MKREWLGIYHHGFLEVLFLKVFSMPSRPILDTNQSTGNEQREEYLLRSQHLPSCLEEDLHTMATTMAQSSKPKLLTRKTRT